jgi:basic amino acid/polyamine antiporter, APA family
MAHQDNDLKKALNIRGLTLIAIGACIGSGIFVAPSATLRYLPHHGWSLIAWLIGGVIAFLGAMTFSELGARFPREGGVYVYLREAYGDLAGFLYGWIILFVVTTGALAALCLAMVDYLSYLVPIDPFFKILIAIVTLGLLTVINIMGVSMSQKITSFFTILKLVAMIAIVFVGLYHIPTMQHKLNLNLGENIPPNLFQGILLAFVGVFWSMGGWHHATYLSGEAINPTRTVPRAMMIGTSIVTLLYLAIIVAYMILLPIDIITNSSRLAGDAVGAHISWGGKAVSLAISISIIGSIAIYTMSAPRIYFAMARDGIFFKFLADVSPKYGTPAKAMIFQSVWASVLILLWGAFDKLATFVTFMDIVFMALATGTIFVFKKRYPDFRGYKVKPFPLVPLLYLMITVAFVINAFFEIKSESWSGILILLLGIPGYYYFKNNK